MKHYTECGYLKYYILRINIHRQFPLQRSKMLFPIASNKNKKKDLETKMLLRSFNPLQYIK